MVTLLGTSTYTAEAGADQCLYCARYLRDGEEAALVLTPLLEQVTMHRRCFLAAAGQVCRPGQRRWPLQSV